MYTLHSRDLLEQPAAYNAIIAFYQAVGPWMGHQDDAMAYPHAL